MNILINAAVHVQDNHHMSMWVGIFFIALSLVFFICAAVLAVRDYMVVLKRYQRARTCMRYLPYPMRRVRH